MVSSSTAKDEEQEWERRVMALAGTRVDAARVRLQPSESSMSMASSCRSTVDSFNIDDCCAQIQGSYRAISREVRKALRRSRADPLLNRRAPKAPPLPTPEDGDA
jgi:hypothetical protein